jgi:probable rRNA maturation factor
MRIKIINEQNALDLDGELLSKVGRAALKYAGADKPVTAVFVDEARIRGLNMQFLGRDDSTDVLAFPYNEKNLLGEIVINTEEALNFCGGDPAQSQREIALYLVHGILHLAGGYDDRTDEEAKKMRDAEDEILEEFGFKAAKRL